jgi:hypothetical protein
MMLISPGADHDGGRRRDDHARGTPHRRRLLQKASDPSLDDVEAAHVPRT